MREMLGAPNKFSRSDSPVFGSHPPEGVPTNSYLYRFKNADIKLTSKDNEKIDTITVMSRDDSVSLDGLPLWDMPEGATLVDVTVTKELLEAVGDSEMLKTRFDSSFALAFYSGAPMYDDSTLFGFSGKYMEYEGTKDPAVFLGDVIDGICVSYSPEESYFIYESELRY
jgi:hypothetical protein